MSAGDDAIVAESLAEIVMKLCAEFGEGTGEITSDTQKNNFEITTPPQRKKLGFGFIKKRRNKSVDDSESSMSVEDGSVGSDVDDSISSSEYMGRPSHLPPKAVGESEKHKKEVKKILKKLNTHSSIEQVEARNREKREKFIQNAILTWEEVVRKGSKWDSIKNAKFIEKLLFKGVPPKHRSGVWALEIGNSLSITRELYGIFLQHSRDIRANYSSDRITKSSSIKGTISLQSLPIIARGKEDSCTLVELDVGRTFPDLKLFSSNNGPLHEPLINVLSAYASYRPDVGYVQGMSCIAAVLLLNMNEFEAFSLFANLLQNDILTCLYRIDLKKINVRFRIFERIFKNLLPKLFKHFKKLSLTVDIYLFNWLLTLYGTVFPLDTVVRVWDNYFLHGEIFLYKVGISILTLLERTLCDGNFERCCQLLIRIPKAHFDEEKLFDIISKVSLSSSSFKAYKLTSEREVGMEV